MAHKCNLCGKQMKAVNDIELDNIEQLKGMKIRGWRCKCGNSHSHPDDVDVLVDYYKAVRSGMQASIFKSGNSTAVRLPRAIVRLLKLESKKKLNIETNGNQIILTIAD
jgi:hypothetical protein